MGFRPRTTGVSVAVILAMGVPLASASAAGAAPEYKGSSVFTTYNTMMTTAKKATFNVSASDDTDAAVMFVGGKTAHGTVDFVGSASVSGSAAPYTDTIQMTYTPDDTTSTATYNDTATITMTDGDGNKTTQTVTIAVKDNKVPTGTAITGATAGVQTSTDITLNGSDDQTSAGNLTYKVVEPVENGSAMIVTGTNKVKVTPDATGKPLTFKYTVSDDMGGTSLPISVTVNVTKGSSVGAVSVTGTKVVGAEATLSATVSKLPSSASETLTGGVTFYSVVGAGADAKETSLGAGTRDAGTDTWSLKTTKLPAGASEVIARYAGDSVFAKSESTPAPVSVAKATAKVTVTAPSTARVGQPIDVSAVVAPTTEGGPAASDGKVQFKWTPTAGGEVKDLGSPVSLSNGSYSAKIALPSVATDGALSAVFTEDTNLADASNKAPIKADKGASSVTVTVPQASYEVGSTVKLTATVVPTDGVASPAGKVEFWDNGNPIDAAAVQAQPTTDGKAVTATYDYKVTGAGEHKITAYYQGDANLNRTLDSVGATFTVTAASATVDKPTVTPATGSKVGETVALSTTVKTTATPAGRVQFYVAKGATGSPVPVGEPQPVGSDGSVAASNYTLTSAGSNVFTAKYLGDSNVTASAMSAQTAVDVTAATATIAGVLVKDAKDATLSSVAAGIPVKLTAAITPPAGLSASDAVTFYEGDPAAGGKKLGNGTLDPKTGVAAMNYTFDTVGTHNFFAVYEGNDNLAKDTTDGGSSLSVTKATPAVALTANPGGVGKPVELTASVNTKGASADGAKIQFTDAASGQKIGEPVAVVNGKATISTGNITNAGTYQYTAELAQTANLEKATDTQSVKVATATSSQKLEAKTGSDGKVTLTSTVSGPEGVSTDGKVTFYVDNEQVGSADVSKGIATLGGLDVKAGKHSVSAIYTSAGDLSNSLGSTVLTIKGAAKVEVTAPEKVTAKEAATFAIKVTADAALAPFGGVVTLHAGGKVVGTGKVAADGTGLVSATFAEAGTQNVVAAFEGNDTLTTADSAAVEVTVAAAPIITPPTDTPSTPALKDAQVSAPAVSGKAVVGQRLTGKVASHTKGTTLTYQWLRNGAPISRATSASYTLTAADYAKKISLKVTAAGNGFKSAQAASNPVTVSAGTFVVKGGPKLAGSVKTGATLKLNRGTWTPAPSFSYEWLRDGKLIKSGVTSYKLTTADRGHTIRVRVIGKKAGYTTATKYTNTTSKVK